ncbi:MAG: hypothetical protein KAR42_04280 [candidate division Zixibacteria bacterium]|nr:hypothetical protein [candidate division Zixibacteria bacterium]
MITASASFCVQVKSNEQPIRYVKPHAVDWIFHQDNPLFICTANKNTHSLKVFSTWRMLNVFLYKSPSIIRLIMKNQKKGDYIHYRKEETQADIYLGDPVIELSVNDINNKDILKKSRLILKDWISIDRLNLARREAGLYWVEGPIKYSTNIELKDNNQDLRFYSNQKNLNISMDNFVRGCIGAYIDLEKTPSKKVELELLQKEIAVFINKNKRAFDPYHMRLLQSFRLIK